MAGLLAGPFLSMVDSNIVNVALPDIASQLHTTLDVAQWILTGYLLALAAGLAASAYLAKRFGTGRVYLASLIGFTLASALCALAPSIGALIAARVLQGALGAALVPLAMTMLLGGEHNAARGMPAAAGIVLFLAPALGPTLGGLLIHVAGWPLIFLINVPFGLLGALGMLRVRAPAAAAVDRGVRFDPLGMLLLAGGLALAIYGTTEGPQMGWGSSGVWPELAGGGVLLLAYAFWAQRIKHPAVDLKLLRHAQPALAVLLCTVASVVMFSMLVLVPIFIENLQGQSPLVAGLTLLPQGLVTGIGLVLGTQMARYGVRVSALLGLLLLTLCTAALLLLTLTTPAWVTALILSGRGLAIGLVIQPLLTAMLAELTPAEIPDGNTLFNVAERLGGSVGIAVLITFFTQREQGYVRQVLARFGVPLGGQGLSASGVAHLPPALRAQLAQAAVTGFHDTIWLLTAISALGLLAALLLRNRTIPAAGQVPVSETSAELVMSAE
jgi:EmrB/QacA subfamily drug resistance transporter